MQPIHRAIHPEIRIDDEKQGICTYVASDQTVDSYNEVILASGWRFTNFVKNSPCVDSHDYSTIGKLIGKVIDFKVTGKRLVETVKWAIGCGNDLAEIGWKMTVGGYLKAVSVGFYPVSYLTPNSQGWKDTLRSLGLADDASVRCIYTEQEQCELSACIIGANPNALVGAKAAGILRDSHLQRFPAMRHAIEAHERPRIRSFSFGSTAIRQTPNPMSTHNFLSRFHRATGKNSQGETLGEFESARAGSSPSDLQFATQAAVAKQRGLELREAVDYILADDEIHKFWNDLARYLYRKAKAIGPQPRPMYERAIFPNSKELNPPRYRGIDLTPAGFGNVDLLPPGVVDDLWDLLLQYGSFKTLGVRKARSAYTKIGQTTALPQTIWINPTQGPVQVTSDTQFAGSATTQEMNILASLLPVAQGLAEDVKIDLASFLLENFTKGLYSAIDYVCFQANGATDSTNGGMTGIFQNGAIATVNALAGGISIANLQQADFENVIAAANSAVLQRDPHWWISPSFLPQLAKVRAGTGDSYVLRGPGHTGSGWYLCNFPVVWASQCPSTNAAGAKAMAFGEGAAYGVSIRREVGVDASSKTPQAFGAFQIHYLATLRAICQTLDPTGFATLTLAAK